MARINIEDTLFKDDSFSELTIKLGSKTMAIGAIVEAFILAQKHYLTTVNDRLIPLNEWQRLKVGSAIVESGFAEIRKNGVYVRGSNEQFSWLLQRSEAGKSSAKMKAKARSTTVDFRSTKPDGSQPLTPTLTLTLKKEKNTTTTGIKQNVDSAWEAWNQTLESFGVEKKKLSPSDEQTLSQAILNLGFERTLNALVGKRYEQKTTSYDPASTLSLEYCLSRNFKTKSSNHERLENLALSNKTKKQKQTDHDEAERVAIHGSAS